MPLYKVVRRVSLEGISIISTLKAGDWKLIALHVDDREDGAE